MNARHRVARLVGLAAVALPLLACASAPSAPPHAGAGLVLAPAPVGSLARAQALGDVYLAGQPSADDLALFAELGVKTVVNLRPESEPIGYDERAAAAELGLDYVNVPYNRPEQLDDALFRKGREVLGGAERPLLLHCASGNRVGALWIPWRVLDGGVELEAAVAEAKAIGLKSAELEARARDYVRRQTQP